MRELLQRHKEAIVTFVAVVLPLFLLYFHGKNPGKNTVVTNFLLDVTSPAQSASHRLIGSVEDVWLGYLALVDAEDDNVSLRDRVDELEGIVVEAQQLQDENELLREELDFKRKRKDLLTVSAHVIGKDVSAYARVLRVRIDGGTHDTLREGMPVVTSKGLVGRLRQVTERYAEVMLSVDTRSEVAVKVVGKAITGMVRGKGDKNQYRANLLFLPGDEELEAGDRVVTSGHGQVFPANIEVGKVQSLKERQNGVYQQLEITPSVRFGVLEVLQVVIGTRDDPMDSGTIMKGGKR